MNSKFVVLDFKMASGVVIYFNKIKGFGLIQPDDDSDTVFVNINAVKQAGMVSLTPGQKIIYEKRLPEYLGRASAENLKKA